MLFPGHCSNASHTFTHPSLQQSTAIQINKQDTEPTRKGMQPRRGGRTSTGRHPGARVLGAHPLWRIEKPMEGAVAGPRQLRQWEEVVWS